MNTRKTNSPIQRLCDPALGLLSLCLLLTLQPDCRADTIYNFTLNTSAIAGQSGNLAFDLIGGDALSANNTAIVNAFGTDGTLSDTSTLSLTDVGFFNEELRGIVFGSFLNFTLQLSENNTPSGLDSFSFFLLDSDAIFSLIDTSDPTGAAALLAIDIDGSSGGQPLVFDAVTSGSLSPANVSEGGNTGALLLLSFGAAYGLGFLGRSFPRQSPV